jgi:hypothetical protein
LIISMTVQYCREIRELLEKHSLAGGRYPTAKAVFYYYSSMGKFTANSAMLIGAYSIQEFDFTAENSWNNFSRVAIKFMPFGDSGK